MASVGLLALIGVSACSGDDDDDAADATATEDAATGEDGDENGDGDDALATAQADLEQAQADLDAANATIAEQETEISDLTAKVDTAEAAAVDVQAQLAAETTRADTAEADLTALQAQVDAFTANFPVTIPASLEPFANSLVGAYDMTLTEAFCDGLATCGQQRAPVRADIIQGPAGLQLQVPNVFTTGLFMVQGSLFGVTDSNLIVGPCADGTQTNSQVSTTIFADGITVAADGTQTLSGLGASVFVAVNPAGSCGAGNIFFAAKLTPV
jgi:hypothetical protein